jgi:hypothetical protein
MTHSSDLAAPLATSRVLLSGEGEGATLFQFLSDAAEWRNDASARRDGMTFCYLAGAGLRLSRAETVFLLEDFGTPVGGLLRNAITIESITRGMMPSEWERDVARTQLVFADLLTSPRLLDAGRASTATPVFDVPVESVMDDRDVMQVLALRVGPSEVPDAPTVFSDALLESLQGHAGEVAADGTWAVTTAGLGRALPVEVDRREQESASAQRTSIEWEGRFGGSVVTRLVSPPTVPVEVNVAGGAGMARLVVRDSGFVVIATETVRPDSAPVRLWLEPGIFLFEVHRSDGELTRSTAVIMPPATRVVLGASEASRDG